MNNYITDQINDTEELDKVIELFETSIDYSIQTFEKGNIRVFLDYFYNTNKKMFEIYDTVSFIQQEEHFFSIDDFEYAKDVLNALFEVIDYNYTRKDFFEFFKTLTTKDQTEEYFKKIYLDFFEGQHLSKEKQLQRFQLEKDIQDLFQSYSKNVENVSYIQEHSIDDEIIKDLNQESQDAYFVKKNGKYYFKPSFTNLKLIKSNCQNSLLRKKACDLLSKEGKFHEGESNLSIANKLIQTRSDMATLLNKKSYIHLAIEKNLLNKTNKVEAFLDAVHKEHYEKALNDILELREFIKDKFQVNNLTYQDLYYYAGCYKGHMLREELYDYNTKFKTKDVLKQVFKLYHDIFDLTFKKVELKNCFDIEGVEGYEVYHKKELKTYIILDLYEREGKPEDNYVSTLKKCYKNNVGILLINLFFNDSDGTSLEDIAGLLHEIGHVAENIIYDGEYIFDDHTAYLEKDACEIISTTMEQYAKEKNFLLGCSNNKLSESEIQEILNIENFLASMDSIYLLACAEYDYKIHNNFKGNIELLHVDIFNKRSPLFDELGENLAYNFVHAFDGFYSGNYYCYLLAEVLAKNLFESFKDSKSMQKLFKYKIAGRQEGVRLEDNLNFFYDNKIPEKLSFLTE